MRITKLQIQRYRSLYAVDVGLVPLMALFGPNGAGKSNFVDALSFFGIALTHGLETAINAKGGPDRIVFRGTTLESGPVSIRVTAQVPLDEIQTARPGFQSYLQRAMGEGRALPQVEIVYGFGVSQQGSNGLRDFAIAFEEISIGLLESNQLRQVLTVKRDGDDVQQLLGEIGAVDPELWTELVSPFGDDAFAEQLRQAYRSDQLMAAPLSLFNPVIAWITGWLGRVQTYSITPAIGKLPGLPSTIGQLDASGASLPTEVRTIQEHFPAVWERIMERMQELEPRLSTIETSLTTERWLVLRLTEGDSTHSWRATEVSDGTIRMLAMLTALYDPRFPIVAIEEPENSANAWAVRSFVNACRQVAEQGGKHVVLTSHSPALINFLTPDEVRVGWRDQLGRTNIKPLLALDPDIQGMWEHGDVFLFDVLDSGLVREAVPGTFS